jgi:hypothetical protein
MHVPASGHAACAAHGIPETVKPGLKGKLAVNCSCEIDIDSQIR